MAETVDLKVVVKHLVDGTFDENLCRVCLLPLETVCENIFTQICKEDQGYCIAEILQNVCDLEFSETDNFSVCSDCFLMASTAYKLYITSKRSDEILNFYIDELEKNVFSIDIPDESSSDTLCITLPEYIPTYKNFDYDIEGCLIEDYLEEQDSIETENVKKIYRNIKDPQKNETGHKRLNSEIDDDELVVVKSENGQQTFYKVLEDGTLEPVSKGNKKESGKFLEEQQLESKLRRKREPMTYIKCNYCPVKYRFLAKLKLHMKSAHDADLLICKICKYITESPEKYENHLASHTGIHLCEHCNTVFKKRETMIAHLKWHEVMKNDHDTDSFHVCELCGFILLDEEQLKEHYDKKHNKKYTCYYCGKMYKGESSCEAHILKHEYHMKKEAKRKKSDPAVTEAQSKSNKGSDKKKTCATCGKTFVDERSLMWHSMLHTNERPHICDTCGRGFISVNRLNQHILCAHTMPTKRCPLCPALFHLRSMVNTHIKKVHLKAHKRRNRSSKHQNMDVYWRTEPVPIQELGVDIQSEILELKTRQQHPEDDQLDF